jgi:peptidoglycan/LPS O-acetylase OafA/YrhL
VSILLVVGAHSISPDRYPTAFSLFGHLGNTGVRVFFLISGFLITTLLLKEHADSGRISLPKFYMRRVIRIFPAFYVYVGVIALLAWIGRIQLLPGDMAHALTYTVNYQHERSWYVNHLWSLSVEEQFYLLWPAALLLAGPRRALKGAAAAIIIVPLIRCWIYWDFAHQAVVAGQALSPYYATALDRYFQAVCDSLATGCVLAGCYEALGRVRRYIELQRQVWYPLLPLALILASGALHKVSVPVYLILGQSGANIGIALLLDYWVRRPDSISGRVLNLGWMAKIGIWSYSIYLWQELLLDMTQGGISLPFPLNIAAVVAVSVASYYCVEKQTLKLRRYFSPSYEPLSTVRSV